MASDPAASAGDAGATRTALLDAAERLFATRGVAGASLRAITREAEANLASVHYHFGSKEELVRAVLARRLVPLGRQRLEALEACHEGGGPSVECIVRAFVAPALRMSAHEGWGRQFGRLVLRALLEPGEETRGLLLEQFQESIRRFCRALSEALPQLPEAEVYWRFHFMVGAMAHTVGMGEMAEVYSRGICRSRDVETLIDLLVSFLTAAMESPPVPGPEET